MPLNQAGVQFLIKKSIGGHFALGESLLHINNALELKAVLFGLKSLCSHLRQTI